MEMIQTIKAVAVAIRNLVLGGNLVSLQLWRQPKRLVGYVNENLFLYQAYTATHGLPQKNVFDVLSAADVETIQLANLKLAWTPYGEPWFHNVASYAVDIVSLCLLCQILKPEVVFEIGTLRGYTAYHFALNSSSPEARIYTLDLPQDQPVTPKLKTTVVDEWHIRGHGAMQRYCFEGTPVADKITCLFGDSATFDFSPFEKQVDLFFIDGAHSYEYVRSDTLNALKCCHSGSVIAWHDFGRKGVNGVSKWLVELSQTYQIYSVPGGSLAFMEVP